MTDKLRHKGYVGTVETSLEDDILCGEIEHIDDLVTYEGETIQELRQAFQDAVDGYLQWCEETGRAPSKSFSGTFNVRIGPERHQRIAEIARRESESINNVICQAIDAFLEQRRRPDRHATFEWLVQNAQRSQTVVGVGRVTTAIRRASGGRQLRNEPGKAIFEDMLRQVEWQNDEPKTSH